MPTLSTPPHTAPHTAKISNARDSAPAAARRRSRPRSRQVRHDDRRQGENATVGEVDLARDRVRQREAGRVERDDRAVGQPIDQQLDQDRPALVSARNAHALYASVRRRGNASGEERLDLGAGV